MLNVKKMKPIKEHSEQNYKNNGVKRKLRVIKTCTATQHGAVIINIKRIDKFAEIKVIQFLLDKVCEFLTEEGKTFHR